MHVRQALQTRYCCLEVRCREPTQALIEQVAGQNVDEPLNCRAVSRRSHRPVHRPAFVPPTKAGHLYYVRLRTPVGIVYKLGFTTLDSVHARLSFRGDGTDKLIERVLLFAHFNDAWDLEQELHMLFRRHATFSGWDEAMPLFANGQSELYREDVLDLDHEYSRRQSQDTAEEIALARQVALGADEASLRAQLNDRRRERDEQERQWAEARAATAAKPSGWMGRAAIAFIRMGLSACTAILKLAIKLGETENDRRNESRIVELRGMLKDTARIERVRQLRQLNLRGDTASALQALKQRDLEAFERLIDIEQLAANAANAMAEDLNLPSDYMGVANNCGLMDLVELMHEEGGCRDLLLKPVEQHYARTLRDFVMTHRLGTEDLLLPDDIVYYHVPADLDELELSTLSDYFGLKDFLDAVGHTWTLPEPAAISITGDGRCEFSIAVTNERTGFSGQLTVSVRRKSQERLNVAFPNFLELSYQAFEHDRIRAGEPDLGLAHRVHQARQYRELRLTFGVST